MIAGALRAMLYGCVLICALACVARAAGPLPDVGAEAGAVNFAQVLEPHAFEFPRDHGPHPDYRQEWWYVTGNLDAADGERFGFELTFFRFAVAPPATSGGGTATKDVSDAPTASTVARNAAASAQVAGVESRESAWRARQIYLAHFAVTDVARGRFRFAQKVSREATGLRLAGAINPPLRVWIDDWSLAAVSADDTHWVLRAAQDGYELTLDAQALQQPVLNGDRGFSRKSSDPGSASYYYSIPRVAVSGRLVRDGKSLQVHGLAWFDREWGSGALGSNEQGWDWFALQMTDGSALMFYALRNRDGSWDANSAGTWIAPDGQSRPLSAEQVRIDVLGNWTNLRGERYPGRWRVRVPTSGLDVEVRPVFANQELATAARYWEGAVDVTGASAGRRVDGRGYVDLVGYAAQ
jgi:predicted secreted hydrolase